MGGAVFVRTLQLQHDLAGAVELEPFVGDGRPGDVAAELLEFCTLIGLNVGNFALHTSGVLLWDSQRVRRPVDLTGVMLHEVGHWLGLPHFAGQTNGIMGDTFKESSCLTDQELGGMSDAIKGRLARPALGTPRPLRSMTYTLRRVIDHGCPCATFSSRFASQSACSLALAADTPKKEPTGSRRKAVVHVCSTHLLNNWETHDHV